MQHDASGLVRTSRALLVAGALAALAAGCGGSKKDTLQSITVSPAMPTISPNTMTQFTATLNYQGGRGPSVRPAVVWSSSDTNIATIDSGGRALGKAPGMTTITARAGGKMGTAVLRVSAMRVLTMVQVTPANPSVPVRRARALTATGIYSDGTNADLTAMAEWTSSVPANATVTNAGAKGLVIGVKAGTTRISARVMDVTGETTVTVTEPMLRSLTINPPTATIVRGSTRAFTATAAYDDSTTLDVTSAVTWSSSMTAIATISNTDGTRGVATGVAAGETTITAELEGRMATARLTVSGLTPTMLVITPANPTLPRGATEQLTATVTFSDNSTQDVTDDAMWSSATMTVATIDADGEVTAVAMGTSVVTAAFGGVMGTTTVTVTDARVATITVTPSNGTMAKGTTQQYAANARYTDNTMRDVTDEVTWGSTTETVATVSNATGSKGLVSAVGAGEAMITAALDGQLGSTGLTVTDARLTAIAISPENATIANNTSLGFQARGLFSDGTNQDITTQVAWQSSNAAVATISNADGSKGTATAVAVGFVDITASLGTVSKSTRLTVTDATLSSITVTPPLPRLARNTSVQLRATGLFSDGTVQDLTNAASWSSTLAAVATVSATGRATAVSAGTATVRAVIGSVMGSATITVTDAALTSITISPANPTIARGTSVDLSASGVFNDGTNQDLTDQVTWESAASAVATVESGGATPGRVRGNAAGTAMITARLGTISGTTTVTVTNAMLTSIAVAPAAVTIAKTTMTALTATGTFTDSSTMPATVTTQNLTAVVFWQTSNATVATVSNGIGSEGHVTGLTAGMANITATLLGVTGTSAVTVTNAVITSMAVTPANPSVVRGTTQQFTATGTFTEGATVTTQNLNLQAVWVSATPAVAVISNAAGSRGLATGLTPGTSVITATFGGVSGMTTLTVRNMLTSVSISPGAPSVVAGSTVQLTLTGTFEDNSTSNLTEDATWSSNNAVASVSTAMGTRGLVTAGAGAGTSVITATVGGTSAMVTVTVTAAPLTGITLSPLNSMSPLGTNPQFMATGTYMAGPPADVTGDVTWTSSNPAVAEISNAGGSAGRVTTRATGTTTITATLGGVTASTMLTVTPAMLTTITINPANIKIAKTTKLQLQAVGTFTDMSTVDLTGSVTWGTGDTAVATISNAAGEQGQVLGVAAGNTTVTATSGAIVGMTPIQVTNATITSMAVTPANATMPAGVATTFNATGTFFDAMTNETTSQNLNLQATWASSNTAVATISNAAGIRGRAFALAVGMTNISAVFNGVSGSTVLTVTMATLTAISVTPNAPSIAKGTTQQFTATGIYSDNTTQPLTLAAAWSSNHPAATINNTGLATGVAPGVLNITATHMGVSGTATLTVTNATIQQLVVRGAPPPRTDPDPAVSIAAGTTHQYYAVGVFSDGTEQDLTSQVTWASSNLGQATINAAGLARGVMMGMPTITAIFRDAVTGGTIAASKGLTVTGATLTSIAITPANPTVAAGILIQLTATGTFSDGTTQNITESVSWSSATPGAVTVDDDPTEKGQARGVTAGMSSVITASSGAVMATTTVTVSAAVLQSITVSAPAANLAIGAMQQYTATGMMSDGSTPNLTTQVTWASTNPSVASISNTLGTQGRASAIAAGTTTISAIFNGQIGSTMLTVP